MMRITLAVFGYLLLNSPAAQSISEIAKSNNLFAGSVYKEALKDLGDEKNLVASPFSAEVVLAMTLSGAKGETAQELRKALQLPDDQSKIHSGFQTLIPALKSTDKYALNVANKVYVQKDFTINESFQNLLKQKYESSIEKISFHPDNQAAANTINEWVEQETHHKIQDLLSPQVLNEHTKLVLVNALHFKGNWSTPFSEIDTKPGDFHLKTPQQKKTVDFMTQTEFLQHYHCSVTNAQFLELSIAYETNSALVIVLPREHNGLKMLEDNIDKVLGPKNFTSTYVDVKLPKFKLESEIDFKSILNSLGVKKAFDDHQADLSGIAGKPHDLSISEVRQKAVIDVNEIGLEASAATYLSLVAPYSAIQKPEPIPFHADHPFIYYLKVKDTILFVGKVVNP